MTKRPIIGSFSLQLNFSRFAGRFLIDIHYLQGKHHGHRILRIGHLNNFNLRVFVGEDE